ALTKRIDEQSKEIHDYKTSAVHALPDHIDDNIKALEAAKGAIEEFRGKIAEEQARKATIEGQLADLESKGGLDQPIVHEKTPDEAKLDELQIALSELETRFTPQHPEVQNAKRHIHDLEQTIASQPKKGRSEPSPNYIKYSELKAELEGSQQRIAGF